MTNLVEFTTTDNYKGQLFVAADGESVALFVMREANKMFNRNKCYNSILSADVAKQAYNTNLSAMNCEEVLGTFFTEAAKQLVTELAQNWVYGDYSFDEWYESHNGKRGFTPRVASLPKEQLRVAYEALDSEIKVGMPATIFYYSDRRGVTVTEVFKRKNGKVWKVGVKHNAYKHTRLYDGECECDPDTFWKNEIEYFTLRKNGGWYADGEPKKRGSVELGIGFRRTFLDPRL